MNNKNDCQNRREPIAALVLGELQAPVADELKSHIDTCMNCRSIYQAMIEEEETIRSAFRVIDDRSKAIGDKLVAEHGEVSIVHDDISEEQAESQDETSAVKQSNIWRIIMKNRITKLAAAAVIFVAVLVAFDPFNVTNTGGVAWGKVAQRVQQIETFIFGLTIKVSDPNTAQAADQTTAKWIICLSEEYGFRMDIWANEKVVSWYVAPNADKMIMVVPEKKELIELPLLADKRSKMPEEYKDPREYISRFMSRPYKELGRSVINGVRVEGIEVTDPPTDDDPLDNAVGRLWVDTETELPVRIEIEGMAEKKMVQWIMDFKWAEAVSPILFDPNHPITIQIE